MCVQISVVNGEGVPFKHRTPFLFLAHTICPTWFGSVPAHTVTQGPELISSPLSPHCTIWHTWPSCSPLDMVMTAPLCFGLERHLSPPLNSLLVRTNHLTCGRWECIMSPCALKEKKTDVCVHIPSLYPNDAPLAYRDMS